MTAIGFCWIVRKQTAALRWLSIFALLSAGSSGISEEAAFGYVTEGPAVFKLVPDTTRVVPGPVTVFRPPPIDLPPEIRRGLVMFRTAANFVVVTNTVRRFDHFLPESLINTVWTNFIANTNGRSTVFWDVRKIPFTWPAPTAPGHWNTNCLMWGMKGLTAMSPSWEAPPGWIPLTAFTRRHGYARGHGMGRDRIGTEFVGLKVWFLTTQNEVVQRKVVREVVRTRETSGRDYTILLFDEDLPDSIEPMRVVHEDDLFGALPSRYTIIPGAPPCLLFKADQFGKVSADVPGFSLDTMKAGDSGCPNMLPMPGELVFWNGRTTSGVSPEMQADMDKLCRLQKLNPAKYQLQYVDLTRYPKY